MTVAPLTSEESARLNLYQDITSIGLYDKETWIKAVSYWGFTFAVGLLGMYIILELQDNGYMKIVDRDGSVRRPKRKLKR